MADGGKRGDGENSTPPNPPPPPRPHSQGRIPEQTRLCLDSCLMSQNRKRGAYNHPSLKGPLHWRRALVMKWCAESLMRFDDFHVVSPCVGRPGSKPGDRR